ncbi:hypothetical protein [Gluconacetobacter diazotrophicus]|uniref:Uncharacterized protein n=2 Tax=Gluconacetobacter diazotrophicus TaxID=33996 RepID=A0A7W4FBY2_GLUDI|nr:hypothetical protein [Gluconacetobacter diazotrophicus]MBB2154935.1 hypothetical protein [Gluconacetobacter diazotrophicus]CAP56073.1 putative membrane protein [Gluconacetobacter diazotrophicus PA1 5]
MMQGRGVPQGPLPNSAGGIFRGMMLLGRGRREGLNCFGATQDSVLTALAPRVALWLVGALLTLVQAPTGLSGTKILFSLCLVLTPIIVTHQLARLWGREALWPRYMTAALWCDWLVLFVMLIAVAVVAMVLPAGLNAVRSALILNGIVFAYNLWLTWFIARVGLALGVWRAILVVLAVAAAILVLGEAAAVLPPHYAPWQDFLALPSAHAPQ